MEKYSSLNILIFGLPGSGKTTFAKKLINNELFLRSIFESNERLFLSFIIW